ncbi:MAG: hypothetical protein IPF81_19050 [Bacteroidetes bacterium]|nr:hypothetical protein [Bacteroidota bacterium]
MKKYAVAIHYLDSSIALEKEGNDKFYLKESYNTLAELYSSTGNFEKGIPATPDVFKAQRHPDE